MSLDHTVESVRYTIKWRVLQFFILFIYVYLFNIIRSSFKFDGNHLMAYDKLDGVLRNCNTVNWKQSWQTYSFSRLCNFVRFGGIEPVNELLERSLMFSTVIVPLFRNKHSLCMPSFINIEQGIKALTYKYLRCCKSPSVEGIPPESWLSKR